MALFREFFLCKLRVVLEGLSSIIFHDLAGTEQSLMTLFDFYNNSEKELEFRFSGDVRCHLSKHLICLLKIPTALKYTSTVVILLIEVSSLYTF